ncbi:ABC transporter substrate-binding protein [Herbiconiux sp. L3-i23]|uniref:ABC transporter substrate-binding protein n=1 Tax=Herbiconiux sp. L3-i23 TaxID=2905871 RepID=UPI002051CA4C|nr:ABC transporter substrate-binding protein [Herbiconiux sp. L3-i23]BDI22528.1 branched-chain amino acid ABC transporter substrate-binding protein [Herbiconiux sp. L3-i23]
MSSRANRSVLLLSLSLVVGLAATGCSSDSGEPGSSDQPIKIGAISSLTGPAPFPEVPGAAQAVFDQVNDEGGINGRMIEYFSEDDGADPAKASQSARRLVDEEGVVAMVGGASLVECSANAAFYEQRDVVNIMGTGVEPSCFGSRNIAPVNAGTFNGYESLLWFAKDELEAERICPVILKSEGLTEPYLALLDAWQDKAGMTFAHVDTSVNLGDDPTPAILAVKDAGCDAVAVNPTEPEGVSFMNTVQQQGVLDQADWLMLSNVYTDSAIEALQAQGTTDGVYANSEFLPASADAPEVAEWRETLEAADVPITSLSEGGYVAAQILVEVLRSIDGEITAESVAEALRGAGEIENPLMGMPYVFDDSDAHNPNRASMMVRATENGWEPVGDWVEVPE